MSRARAHRWFTGLIGMLLLLGACHGSASNTAGTGGSGGTVAAGGAAGASPAPTDASSDASGGPSSPDLRAEPDVPADSTVTAPEGVSFPDAPRASCATANDCDFPPSVCADPTCDGGDCPGRGWVVYFDKPACPAGSCVFERRYFQCGNLSFCAAGGCRYAGTAVPLP